MGTNCEDWDLSRKNRPSCVFVYKILIIILWGKRNEQKREREKEREREINGRVRDQKHDDDERKRKEKEFNEGYVIYLL